MPERSPEPSLFSAQVVLSPAASTADQSERVQRALSAQGFAVGPQVGNSFSITGTAQDFEASFGVRLSLRTDGGVAIDGGARRSGLPLHQIPDSLQPLVEAVVFSEPPAFGPGAP